MRYSTPRLFLTLHDVHYRAYTVDNYFCARILAHRQPLFNLSVLLSAVYHRLSVQVAALVENQEPYFSLLCQALDLFST